VETDGNFEDLGRVGICGHAAASILSKAEMVDAGNRISYVNDEYRLDGDGVAMVFRRKLLGRGGRRSSHYSCDMVDVASAASFPVTVVDYMRECRTMLKLLRLRGIVNYGATAKDVLDTDAIFHMSLQRLRGKTKKRMPRVAQVSRATRM
jgi:hypothetical protein